MAIRIARYNGSIASAGGSVLTYNEPTFDIGTGFNGEVNTIAIQDDGKIVVAGSFTTFNNEPAQGIVRLNSDGSKDTSFQTNSGFTGYGSVVFDIGIQSTGKIIAIGNITTFSGNSIGHIVRLNTDGTLDESFNEGGSGFSFETNSVTILDNDKIYVTGFGFQTEYNGISKHPPIRLNADGSLDSTFDYTQTTLYGNMADGPVHATVGIRAGFNALSNGNILFTNFITNQFSPTKYTALVMTTSGGTSYVEPFTTNIGTNFGQYENGGGDGYEYINAYSIEVDGDGKILLGGDFLSWTGNTDLHKLIRLNSNGVLDTTFANGMISLGSNVMVLDMKVLSDGKILVAGILNEYSGVTVSNLIRLNSDGSLDNTFNRKVFSSHIYSIAVQSDGMILVGGRFTSFDGHTHNRFVRLKANGDDATEY